MVARVILNEIENKPLQVTTNWVMYASIFRCASTCIISTIMLETCYGTVLRYKVELIHYEIIDFKLLFRFFYHAIATLNIVKNPN